MHHPTCRVRVVLREVLSEERAAGYAGRAYGRAKSDDEKLAEALKRHMLFKPLKEASDREKKRYDVKHLPWNKKGWKYVTSPKWTDPNCVLRKDVREGWDWSVCVCVYIYICLKQKEFAAIL